MEKQPAITIDERDEAIKRASRHRAFNAALFSNLLEQVILAAWEIGMTKENFISIVGDHFDDVCKSTDTIWSGEYNRMSKASKEQIR